MGQPAARLGDMHVCPMQTPGVPPIPHVGGPILLGCPTVLIGGQPAATMGNPCVCTGPPDTIMKGSMGVMIQGKPAARMGDTCAHGGTIVGGCPTVLIGEIGVGMAVTAPVMSPAVAGMATTSKAATASVEAMAEDVALSEKLIQKKNAGFKASADGTPFINCGFKVK